MAKHVEDFKNTKGQWVQRFTIGEKYTWTTSGVLIPPPLNKFLQSYCNERVHLPQGISLHRGRLYARINNRGVRSTLGAFKPDDMQKAVDLYTEAKTSAGKDWYNDLVSGKYTVDPLVIEFMKNWRYVCDWKPNGQI